MNNETKNEIITKDLMTVPNALSFIRILLITPFVAFFIMGQITGNYIPAVIVLAISGLSDLFDGMIARKFHQESEFGKILDPLGDKLTLIAVGVCLIFIEPYLLPLMIILVVKDVLMIIGGSIIVKKGIIPPKSSWYGKLSTLLFYVSVGIVVLMAVFNYHSLAITLSIIGVTAAMMIFSLVMYTVKFFRIMKELKEKDGANGSADAPTT